MTLAALMQSDVDDVFLNTDEHGESISYRPGGQAARTITVVPMEQPGVLADEQNHTVLTRVVHVLAKRDATTGINDPRMGDRIHWDDKVWDFDGVVAVENGGITVRFKTAALEASGQNRPGRL